MVLCITNPSSLQSKQISVAVVRVCMRLATSSSSKNPPLSTWNEGESAKSCLCLVMVMSVEYPLG